MPKMNEGMPSVHRAGCTDPSGLVSAEDMSGALPNQGWTAEGGIPGVDDMGSIGEGVMKSAVGQQVDFDGKTTPGQPFNGGVGSGPGDVGIPINTLMSVDEPMGPTTGAGLKSAVGENVTFSK